MASFSIYRTYSSNINVSTCVKYVSYITVGGGGGGARPNVGYNFGRTPSGGGYSCAGGTISYGGGPGSFYSGGSGGYGNYRYGQTGRYGGGPWNRAASGYGGTGQGGSGQWRGSSSSYGGGGGGASCCVQYRNSNGAIPGQNVYALVGQGGQQGGSGSCRYGYSGAVYACVCTYDAPTPSISANPTAYRLNGTDGNNSQTSLSWSTGGGESTSEVLDRMRNGAVVESLGQVNRSGSLTVAPVETSEFRLTTINPAFSRSSTVTVTVYQPPTITFSVDAINSTIIQGTSTILRWTVSGDVSSVYIDPGIGSSVLNSLVTVSPTVDTMYTLTASGLGGTGSSQLLVTVLKPPTINASGPINILYNEDIQVTINATNSDGGVSYIAEYLYTDGTNEFKPSVAVPNTIGDEVTVFAHTIPVVYNDYGPFKVRLSFSVDGYGTLEETATIEIPIVIDRMPDAIQIPETDDTFKNEEPVVTPDVEVTTDQIVIADIDIPVEIKADYPVQVEIDNANVWQDIREI
jgi:hypothetical protein